MTQKPAIYVRFFYAVSFFDFSFHQTTLSTINSFKLLQTSFSILLISMNQKL